jgi:hypothetical protein
MRNIAQRCGQSRSITGYNREQKKRLAIQFGILIPALALYGVARIYVIQPILNERALKIPEPMRPSTTKSEPFPGPSEITETSMIILTVEPKDIIPALNEPIALQKKKSWWRFVGYRENEGTETKLETILMEKTDQVPISKPTSGSLVHQHASTTNTSEPLKAAVVPRKKWLGIF